MSSSTRMSRTEPLLITSGQKNRFVLAATINLIPTIVITLVLPTLTPLEGIITPISAVLVGAVLSYLPIIFHITSKRRLIRSGTVFGTTLSYVNHLWIALLFLPIFWLWTNWV